MYVLGNSLNFEIIRNLKIISMKKIAMGLMLAGLVLVGCKDDKKKMDSEETVEKEVVKEVEVDEIKKISMTLRSKSGSTASGTVTFTEDSGVVKMEATLSGLSPGTHAIHIHEKADCTSEDGKSTGGHRFQQVTVMMEVAPRQFDTAPVQAVNENHLVAGNDGKVLHAVDRDKEVFTAAS